MVKIKNRGSTLQIYEPSSGTVIVDNIGSINYANGTLRIVDINPTRIPSGSQIKISVVPANESFVTPDRNNIIKYDNENSLITPVVVSDVN